MSLLCITSFASETVLNQSYLFSEKHFHNIVSKQSSGHVRTLWKEGEGVLLVRRLNAMPECEC